MSVVQIPAHLRKEQSAISAAEPDYQELPLDEAEEERFLNQGRDSTKEAQALARKTAVPSH